MRALPARRIAVSALCATLLLGIAGPVATAADDSARERTHAASRAPVPGADALLAQTEALGDLGGVLTPVTDLLEAALKADNGQLPAADAEKLGQAVKDAIAEAAAAAPAAAPALPAAPVAAPALPAAPSLPAAKSDDSTARSALPADVVGDSLTSLQTAVNTLLTAVTSGDVGQVVPAVTGVLTGLVNVVAATLLGGGLPAPNLPGLPALPSLPVEAPSLPVEAPSLPVEAPALPTGGLLPTS
ncbi:hypothetical protein [Streptomyces sp. NPDC058867]|uniref:hypothetical protein n=1 Tax=unclassified Streptomyces TaxID=2593676 RepID=UPI00369DA916